MNILQGRILSSLQGTDRTAHEIADLLGVSLKLVKSRCSELQAAGHIIKGDYTQRIPGNRGPVERRWHATERKQA